MHPDTGSVLLLIARAAIARELGRTHAAHEDAEWLRNPGACFITLKQGDNLRGCIGTLRAHRPLLEDVKANAVSAAFRDPRFSPLAPAELDITHLEISLLSPLESLAFENEQQALAQLRRGTDGIVFEYGYHQSTFLPQVWGDLPDPLEFMASLKQKAGLPPDFWDTEVKLARYTVSKWCEEG
jgi:AmmeMemoRadiSam system protein A